MSRLEGHSPQRALGSERGSPRCGGGGWGDLGWRTVGAPRSGLWPGEQGVGLAPGAEPLSALGRGLGLLSPKTILSSDKEDSGEGHTTQKVPRTAALGSSKSTRPSNTAWDLGARRAPGDPMPTVGYFLLKLAWPTRGLERLLIKP